MADRYVSFSSPAVGVYAVTFSSADTDAFLTSVATVTSAATYSASNLDGVYGNTLINSRRITFTLKSQTGGYALSAYTITGLADDSITSQVEQVTNTDSAGGITLTSTNLFAKVVRLDFPANTSTSGSIKVGSQEAPSPWIAGARGLYVGGAGNIKVTALDGTSATAFPVAQGHLAIAVSRVWGSADGTTASSIIVLK